MIKTILAFAAAAVIVFLGSATEAGAQQKIFAAPHNAATMAANGWTAEKHTQSDGRVRTDWQCYGIVEGSICKPTTRSQTTVNTAQTTQVGGTNITLTESEIRNVKEVMARERMETSPAPVAPAQVAGGSCWTKHPMKLQQFVTLMKGDDDANWKSNMCGTPTDMAIDFFWVIGWDRPSSVGQAAKYLEGFKRIECRDDLVKNKVFISRNGQKGAPFGKCGDDDYLWATPNDIVVFSETKGGGKALVDKDAILAKR